MNKDKEKDLAADTKEYEIGHRKPPKATQFKRGMSGNPRGRPKGSKNFKTIMNEQLGARAIGNKVKTQSAKPPIAYVEVYKEPDMTKMRKDIESVTIGLSVEELRRRWAEAWGLKPHKHIGRRMLEKSLVFKLKELNGLGLTRLQQKKLEHLVKTYKRNPRCFDDRIGLKAGVRLVRTWKGKRINVLVKENGFEYNGTLYKSLSSLARTITGVTWNGWKFFGLKEKKKRW